MTEDTKAKLQYAALMIPMVLPPWNIICWTIGLVRFMRRPEDPEAHDDADNYAFITDVVQAPITLPVDAYNYVRWLVESRHR